MWCAQHLYHLAALSHVSEAISQRSPWTAAHRKCWALPRVQRSLSGMCVCWRRGRFFTCSCPNVQEVCINTMCFSTLWYRILQKCLWRSVWVSLPSRQLPLKKYVFTCCWKSTWFSFGISLLSYLTNDICYDFSFSLQVFSTSVGLTKTVYNPAALKAVQKSSEEALKKKQVRRTRGNKERKGGGWMGGKQQGLSYLKETAVHHRFP